MSTNFGPVDVEHLKFPTKMKVDWIRVYQPSNKINIGCDPIDFPTQAYINQCVYRIWFPSSLNLKPSDISRPTQIPTLQLGSTILSSRGPRTGS